MILIKGVGETVEHEVEEQKGGLLGMVATTLSDSLLGNMLAGRGMKSKISEREAIMPGLDVIWEGEGTIRADEGTTRASQDF